MPAMPPARRAGENGLPELLELSMSEPAIHCGRCGERIRDDAWCYDVWDRVIHRECGAAPAHLSTNSSHVKGRLTCGR